MRQMLLLAILVLSISSPVLGQRPESRLTQAQCAAVEQDLIDLEKKWNEAFLKNDVATLKRIMADDIVIIYGDGSRGAREKDISNIGKDEQIETSIQDEFQVRLFGDAAVVMSRLSSRGTRAGKKFSGQFRYIDVFEKRDGRWQCVITQNTQIGRLK